MNTDLSFLFICIEILRILLNHELPLHVKLERMSFSFALSSVSVYFSRILTFLFIIVLSVFPPSFCIEQTNIKYHFVPQPQVASKGWPSPSRILRPSHPDIAAGIYNINEQNKVKLDQETLTDAN